jgi:hypothetical protein
VRGRVVKGVACVASVAVVVVAVAGAGVPAGADASGPVRHDPRCGVLQGIQDAAVGVSTGAAPNTARQARVLRSLAAHRDVPRVVKKALRVLADWFAAARDRSIANRVKTLVVLRPAVVAIVRWSTRLCGAPPTSSTLAAP